MKFQDLPPEIQQWAQQGAKPTAPSKQSKTLLQFASDNGYRVTAGFSHGGHNTGSRHYTGTQDNPGAIDIANQGVDYNRLLAAARAQGIRVVNETARPPGQAVWTGPHYHLQFGGGAIPSAVPAARHAAPTIPATPAPPPDPGADARLLSGMAMGQPMAIPTLQTPTVPPPPMAPSPVGQLPQSVDYRPTLQRVLKQRQDEVSAFQAAHAPKPPQQNFFNDLGAHFSNAAKGYTQDQAIQNSGHGIGATVGDIAGGLIPIGGGALGGAGLGGLSFTPFGVAAGAVGGGIAGAGAASAAQDLQAQRIEGLKNPNYGRAIGAGAIGAGLQAIPVLKGASVLETIAKNAALHGVAGGAGSVAQQGVEQGTLAPNVDWQKRVLPQAGLMAAGGTVAGYHGGVRPAEIPAREIAPSPVGFIGRDAQGNVIQRLTADELAARRMQAADTRAQVRQQSEQLGQIPSQSSQAIADLQAGWQERQRPQTPQSLIIPGANETQAMADMGLKQPVIEPTEGGLVIAREGAPKPKPTIEPGTALPEGTPIEPSIPAPKSDVLIDPTTGQPFNREVYVRSSKDIAMERANTLPDEATIPSEAPRREIIPQGEKPSLLDAQGRPMNEIPSASRRIELPGEPKPSEQPLEIPSTRKEQMPFRQHEEASKPHAAPPSGSFVDTINELTKETGLDYNGLKQLKNDIQTRASLLREHYNYATWEEGKALRAKIDEMAAQTEAMKGKRSPEAKALRAALAEARKTYSEKNSKRLSEGKDIREQLKQLKEQYKAVPENVKAILETNIDPETGIAQQWPIDPTKQFRMEDIAHLLDERSAPLAQQFESIMQKGVKARIRYIGEHTGRSYEVADLGTGGRVNVATTEFSPTHFGTYRATYPDGTREIPAVFGYNQRGHERGYYLNKSPKGSMVQQIMSVTDKPAFKGNIPNVYRGADSFNAADLLARGPQTERGFVKTSEAIKAIHEQKRAMRAIADQADLPPDVKQTLQKAFSDNKFSYDDIQSLRQHMSEPRKLAQFCKGMGLV